MYKNGINIIGIILILYTAIAFLVYAIKYPCLTHTQLLLHTPSIVVWDFSTEHCLKECK